MTFDEAKQIARIVGTADSGCTICVGHLVDQMNERFPAFRWVMTNQNMPVEQPDWSDDPDDATSPGLLVTVEPATPPE